MTGWVARPSAKTVLVAHRQDRTSKTLFGVTRNFDANGFCDIVLAQPKSAEHVAGRLWRQLASDSPASPEVLDRLVAAYGPARDLRALTRAILTDDEFVHSRAAIVNTPVEWLVGVIRQLQRPDRPPRANEDGRRHAQGAGTAAVLSTRCRWLAIWPGLDVDRQRRRTDACRDPIGARGRSVRRRGRCRPATGSMPSVI